MNTRPSINLKLVLTLSIFLGTISMTKASFYPSHTIKIEKVSCKVEETKCKSNNTKRFRYTGLIKFKNINEEMVSQKINLLFDEYSESACKLLKQAKFLKNDVTIIERCLYYNCDPSEVIGFVVHNQKNALASAYLSDACP